MNRQTDTQQTDTHTHIHMDKSTYRKYRPRVPMLWKYNKLQILQWWPSYLKRLVPLPRGLNSMNCDKSWLSSIDGGILVSKALHRQVEKKTSKLNILSGSFVSPLQCGDHFRYWLQLPHSSLYCSKFLITPTCQSVELFCRLEVLESILVKVSYHDSEIQPKKWFRFFFFNRTHLFVLVHFQF